MAKMTSGMRMMAMARMGGETEMRRRRDSRGRYMEGGEGNNMTYRPWPEPHIPPYLDRPGMAEDNMRPGSEHRMEQEPYHMRDRNVVNIRDYQDKRKIGFGEDQMMHDNHRREVKQMYGPSDYMAMGMDQHTAEAWVAEMEGSDPAHPHGAKWTPDQVKPFAQKYGFPTDGEKFWEFYAIMNAMYADAYETAKEFNVVRPEFFASLAKGWLHDKDAVSNKAMAYYDCIVK